MYVRELQDIGKQQMSGIMIGTPVYGGLVDVNYFGGMMRLAAICVSQGIRLEVPILAAESLITRARNQVMHKFLKSEADHLFWIDADIGFQAEDVLRLVSMPYDIVCGGYPKKGLNLEEFREWGLSHPNWPVACSFDYAYSTHPGSTVEGEGTCIPVYEAATGFMCMSRKAVQALAAQAPKYLNEEKEEVARVFHTDVSTDPGYPRYLSEDYWVCENWRKLGGKIMMDVSVKLTHSGRWTWKGDLSAQFE